jgi:hypothetical protein
MNNGHFISDDMLVRAGYGLLTSVFAAYDLNDLRRDSDPDPLDDLRRFEDEVQTGRLITLAAVARVLDDDTKQLDGASSAFPGGVGWLEVSGRRTHLSIRDACNKIIHARAILYDLSWADENPLWGRWYAAFGHDVRGKFKAPALELSGSRGSSEWRARVELVPFVIATALTDAYKWNLGGLTDDGGRT